MTADNNRAPSVPPWLGGSPTPVNEAPSHSAAASPDMSTSSERTEPRSEGQPLPSWIPAAGHDRADHDPNQHDASRHDAIRHDSDVPPQRRPRMRAHTGSPRRPRVLRPRVRHPRPHILLPDRPSSGPRSPLHRRTTPHRRIPPLGRVHHRRGARPTSTGRRHSSARPPLSTSRAHRVLIPECFYARRVDHRGRVGAVRCTASPGARSAPASRAQPCTTMNW